MNLSWSKVLLRQTQKAHIWNAHHDQTQVDFARFIQRAQIQLQIQLKSMILRKEHGSPVWFDPNRLRRPSFTVVVWKHIRIVLAYELDQSD